MRFVWFWRLEITVTAPTDPKEKNTQENVDEIVKNTVASTVNAVGELQKEKARTSSLRLALVQYMLTKEDARFIVSQMKRSAPDGTPLFTDKEIEEDVKTAWKLSFADKKAIMEEAGIIPS